VGTAFNHPWILGCVRPSFVHRLSRDILYWEFPPYLTLRTRVSFAMAAAEIYVKQMRKLKHGDALWVPESPVEVGDVGFLDDGAFYRLFNTILPSNHPLQSVGVPATFEPLVIPPNFWNETPNYFVHGTVLKSQSLKEKRIGLEASRFELPISILLASLMIILVT
jgi:hypothetical protein